MSPRNLHRQGRSARTRIAALILACTLTHARDGAAQPPDQEALAPPPNDALAVEKPGFPERTLAERIGPAVVRVEIREGDDEIGNGTGFFVRADGVLVTNHHVVADLNGLQQVAIVMRDGRRVAIIGVLALDEAHDLAVLRSVPGDYPAIELAAPGAVRVGQAITLVGSPLGLDQSVSTGIVAALRADFPEDWKKREGHAGRRTTGPLVQHTAPSTFGASGSPLLDAEARVVAVQHSGVPGTEINFGAHVDSLRALLGATDLDATPRPLGPDRLRNLGWSAAFFGALAALGIGARLRRRFKKPRGKIHVPMPRR